MDGAFRWGECTVDGLESRHFLEVVPDSFVSDGDL